jgi:hypothetical protein
MPSDKVSSKKDDFSVVLLLVQNILESEKIERFKFTPQEKSALLFIIDLLNAHLSELEHL